MDCPNCGVYNPEEREICWRCDRELPKPEEPKKRRGGAFFTQRQMWIMIGIILLIWIFLTWLLPLLFGGRPAPSP
jgi:hypothetical protein